MERGCNICGCLFKEETDSQTLIVLEEHKNKCTKDDPFYDDENSIGNIFN